eukprot:TRINITY_DN19386_c0_g1_i1.p1 TRINITY_DN19386_c0_g1~~TRINITY_DN19386_c0_g1_i1.p1  ORF type:complete len:273 (-),score=121.61 TRINITY_DN19386_c0_g1_i1:106-924(-)
MCIRDRYRDMDLLTDQLQRERDSSRVAIDALERELRSVTHMLEYEKQNAAQEQERARSVLREQQEDAQRRVEELQAVAVAAAKEQRSKREALQATIASERAAASAREAELQATVLLLQGDVQDLKDELGSTTARYDQLIEALEEQLIAELNARAELEQRVSALETDLVNAKDGADAWKARCAELEETVLCWERCVPRLHVELDRGLHKAHALRDDLRVNSELPAVYQVHALEPLVLAKLDECYQKMMALYQKMQRDLREHFPNPIQPKAIQS